MNDRNNTIAGWVLGAGIVALGAGIVTSELFHAERPEKMGYPIEGVAAEGGGGEAEQPIEALLATADPANGAKVFQKCAACHTATKGGANGVGPNLWGVLGKPHGHVPGFAYSSALTGKPGNWDWTNLSEWLKSPRKYAEGTKMTFAGLSNGKDRADVIAYLNQQSDGPLPLPTAPAAGKAEGDAPGGEAGKSADVGASPVDTPATGAVTADPAAKRQFETKSDMPAVEKK
ncbi:cytochrome c family protein [Sphingomonas sp. ID1715]|uniref:c-type cytochrome n=1 Tax=Sphingomonas sp. ID1715 TaxID=1656898 RepID=UPI00148A07D9|nr:cytochrome c family protein [Sphingomonas sp. ID1715]NNM77052.1 cytochrome c family protein [Sphingomonas sp. ID1715]